MAEVAPAAVAKAPARGPTKAKRAVKKTGPSTAELVVKAVTASKDRKGVSLAAVKSALSAGGYDVQKNNSRVKLAIKSLVNKGTLVQTKGTGASGSFKLNKQQLAAKKKPAKKAAAKKPAAKKAVKKPAAKKAPKAAKKPAKKAAKSPKKTRKTAAKKPVKKATKSPKKTKPAKKATKPKAPKAKKAVPKKR
ncbi:histone H1-like [Engraulis encrasicolus]|uniref:histone H1-like n=1 Tax=Engraulis encrasicolus TaxID=184585 RepID=UPI002FD0C911